MPTSYMQKLIIPAFLALSVVALGGASCGKESAKSTPEEARQVVKAMDKAKTEKTAATPKQPVNQEPIPGVDVSELDDRKTERFYRLVGSLRSPCGKAHSLRTSLTDDTSCKRAPFAVRYVISLLKDEAGDDDITKFYNDKYASQGKVHTFNLNDSVPHTGPADAPVKLVEFYDYGCGACKHFAPLLKEGISGFPNEVVLYYKQFPLPSHPDSKNAAQAALAAQKQGKFNEMHEWLFARAPRHKKTDVTAYAKALGLNMSRFEADYAAAAPRVKADMAEGTAADVHGTPTLYINGRVYSGPMHPSYIKLWIEEELAVNR